MVSNTTAQEEKLRNSLADVVGFAHLKSQMDAFMARIEEKQSETLKKKATQISDATRFVIAPHDDYTYVGHLYPLALQKVEAKTVVIFGALHKSLNVEKDKIIFDTFTHWIGPYAKIKVSAFRDEIIKNLPKDTWIEHDSLHKLEHSIEAELPFLQFKNRDVEIIPILLSRMTFSRTRELAKLLSETLDNLMKEKGLNWGRDIAFVASNDCVHYGDEGYSGQKLDPFGSDEKGKQKAVEFDLQIIKECIEGEISEDRVRKLWDYIQDDKDYKLVWQWCGFDAISFGMLISSYLQEGLKEKKLQGVLLEYANTVDLEHIPVSDLDGMGTTSRANLHHWVGFASIVFI